VELLGSRGRNSRITEHPYRSRTMSEQLLSMSLDDIIKAAKVTQKQVAEKKAASGTNATAKTGKEKNRKETLRMRKGKQATQAKKVLVRPLSVANP
jgi:hypothetical protein